MYTNLQPEDINQAMELDKKIEDLQEAIIEKGTEIMQLEAELKELQEIRGF